MCFFERMKIEKIDLLLLDSQELNEVFTFNWFPSRFCCIPSCKSSWVVTTKCCTSSSLFNVLHIPVYIAVNYTKNLLILIKLDMKYQLVLFKCSLKGDNYNRKFYATSLKMILNLSECVHRWMWYQFFSQKGHTLL